MHIGVPKEVKNRENRIAMVPGGVQMLVGAGHQVSIEAGAGMGAGIPDEAFKQAGAEIVSGAAAVWERAEMIVKVKEPIEQEYKFLRDDQILYTYLHLAAAQELGHELIKRKTTAIAYETIQLPDRSLPLLTPMSEVAGRMSAQVGAECLLKHNGGKGLLLGGVPGVKRGRVTILGGGVVGINAAKMAVGLGARVTIMDVSAPRLAYLDDIFGTDADTIMSNPENVGHAVAESDLVIGAVLIAGAKAPRIVSREMVRAMEKDSVLVDVAIDQGGCMETIKPTTHDDPVYIDEDVLHYGVTNIPGDVPKTSTYALTNVTLRYALDLANKGLDRALAEDDALKLGLNTHQGEVTHPAVAEALGVSYRAL